jgi:hypothetical protein
MGFTAPAHICENPLVLREITYTEFHPNRLTNMESKSTHSLTPVCKIQLPLRKVTRNSHFFDKLWHIKSYTESYENPTNDVAAHRLTEGRKRAPHNTCLLRKERSKRGPALTWNQRSTDLNIIYNLN